jgi:hypothetical protein
MGLRFEREKRFIGCRNINFLPFDFYVSTNSGEVVIECHGEQHYRPIAFWGGQPAFEKRVMRDGMKKRFCESRGIQYIEIPYGKPISLVRQMLSVVFSGNVKTAAA